MDPQEIADSTGAHLVAFCYYRLVDHQHRLQKTDSRKEATAFSRRAFLALPMEDRRRILEAQAEQILQHYEKDSSWRDIQGGEVIIPAESESPIT